MSDYPLLWKSSGPELKIITLSLLELSKTWQTAKGSLRFLQRLQETVSTFRPVPNPPPLQPQSMEWSLFEPFGDTFCPKWQIIMAEWSANPTYRDTSSLGGSASKYSSMEWTNIDTNNGVSQLDENGTVRADLETGFDLSPPSMMSNMLENLSADTLYSNGNWFLQDF